MGGEGERCIGLGVPIRLSAVAYASQLLVFLAAPVVAPDEQVPAAQAPTARKVHRERAKNTGAASAGGDLVQVPLF